MNKLKERLIRLNMSLNKEFVRYFIILVLLVVGFVVAALISKTNILFIILGAVVVLYTYFYFTRYKSIEKKIRRANLVEFAHLFTFFRMFLKNGYGVYSSLKEISAFANQNLKDLLAKLLQEIDEDKTITPYMNFAHNFDELIVEEMMVSIYQMVEEGSDSNYLTQFELIFDKFSDILHNEQIAAKDRALGSISTSSVIGSAYLIILIAMGVINLLGVMFNGV